MIFTEEQRKEFEEIARLMIRFLNDNCHPYGFPLTVIITPTNAKISEGICSTGQIMDYVKD
jgi:hypothetical protein